MCFFKWKRWKVRTPWQDATITRINHLQMRRQLFGALYHSAMLFNAVFFFNSSFSTVNVLRCSMVHKNTCYSKCVLFQLKLDPAGMTHSEALKCVITRCNRGGVVIECVYTIGPLEFPL